MSVKRIGWNGTKVEFSKWFMYPNYTEDIFNFLSKKFIVGICGHSVDRQLFLNGCNVSILSKKGRVSSPLAPLHTSVSPFRGAITRRAPPYG